MIQCSESAEPVCGSDGTTYRNSCEAKNAYLTEWDEGTCEKTHSVFNFQFRQERLQSGESSSFSFSKGSPSGFKIASAAKGELILFQNFDRKFLRDKKLKVVWNKAGGNANNCQFKLADGEYDRSKTNQVRDFQWFSNTAAALSITDINTARASASKVALVLKCDDKNGQGDFLVGLNRVEILDESNNVAAAFDYSGEITLDDATGSTGTLGTDDWLEEDLNTGPKTFALQLKETPIAFGQRYNRYNQVGYIYFGNRGGDGLIATSQMSSAGYAYMFKTFPKEYLQGKKLRINWSAAYYGSSWRAKPWYIQNAIALYDGAYDRTSSVDFPKTGGMTYKGYSRRGNRPLQYIGSVASNRPAQTMTVPLRLYGSQQNDVTIMVSMRDSSKYMSSWIKIHSMEILDQNDQVVAAFDSNGPLAMHRASRYGIDQYFEYGICGVEEM